ncbi:MAG: 4Fe-4S binding protein [Desulfobacterales bacterium]|nr:MAG: 4Fe-4S binding protein [Desulfobacterales bacterium]
MKTLGEILLKESPFSEIVMGNTALVRAMIESHTRVITSYPGSPTPEIAEAVRAIPQAKRPFYFEFSTNEKVATEVAYGAAVNGHLSTVFFKSVGLNVAADTFVQLSLMNIIGGMVVVLGDDPGANSSQNEQDNRHYARLSYTPILEPSSPSEIYTYYKAAVDLSRKNNMPIILRLTTHVCHAKEKVHFQAWKPQILDKTSRFDVKNGPYVPIAADVFPLKRSALENLEEIKTYADRSPLNQTFDNNNKRRGIITMGLPFLSLMDVLEKTQEKPDILKLGVVHPIPENTIKRFLEDHAQVKIIEELDNLIEKEIKSLAYDHQLSTQILGKMGTEDWIGEYTPDKVHAILKKTWNDILPDQTPIHIDEIDIAHRPPQMCPGCGHRSAFHAIKKAIKDTDITVADIGCHTLGYLPPYNVGELMMCMGASTAIGSGLSLFNDIRNVVVFLGDATFFHAGLPGIINALFNKHRLTLILMENGTTAMTGHQDHAASGRNFNEPTDKIPLRQVLEGLGVKHIYSVDTYQQKKLADIVKEAINTNGLSVVIAYHPCMLKFMREQRRKPGFQPRKVDIDQDTCQRLHECIENFACPTFTRRDGGRIEINPDLCIGDGSCIQTCPTQAITSPQIR